MTTLAPPIYTPPPPDPDALLRLAAYCAIPERYRGGFDTYAETVGHERAAGIAWAAAFEEKRDGLYLYGGKGTGKTHLACSILRAVAERGYDAKFIDCADLFHQLRDRFSANTDAGEQTPEELIDELRSVNLLLLDDLGAEKPSGWTADRLLLILGYRYNASLPTLITSNYKLEDMARRHGDVGERIASRVGQMCKVHSVSARDWRAK